MAERMLQLLPIVFGGDPLEAVRALIEQAHLLHLGEIGRTEHAERWIRTAHASIGWRRLREVDDVVVRLERLMAHQCRRRRPRQSVGADQA